MIEYITTNSLKVQIKCGMQFGANWNQTFIFY